MGALENLEQVKRLRDKTKEIEKYNKHQKEIERLEKENTEKQNIIINDDSSYYTENYDSQVKANSITASILSWFLNIAIIIASGVVTFLMYNQFVAKLKDVLKEQSLTAGALANPGKMATLNSTMDAIFGHMRIFVILGVISLVTYAIFLLNLNNDGNDTVNTLSVLATIGLKIANIVIFFKMFIPFIKVDIEFLENYMELARAGGKIFINILITIGIHIAIFILYAIFQKEPLNNFLDSTTLKKARRRDKRYFKKNKEHIYDTLDNEISANKEKINKEINAYPYDKIKKVITEIESESPIFCDFYDLKGQGIRINYEKFDEFCKKLEKSEEMIKSGRAANIQEALNHIARDEQESARVSALHAQTYELNKLNEQLEEYSDGGDDYYY